MGEGIVEAIIEEYMGTTIGIHSPIPYEEPGRRLLSSFEGFLYGFLFL